MHSTITTLFFDFDGVLTLDKTGTESICKYISQHGNVDKDVFEKEYRKHNKDLLYGKVTHADIWNKVCSGIEMEIPIALLYESFINTPSNTEMLKLVQKFKKRGYKTGLITDNKVDRINSIRDHFNLDSLFNTFVVSGEIGSGKGSSKIFEVALQRIKSHPKECLFIDNQQKNLTIPQSMGFSVIHFDDTKRDVSKLEKELNQLVPCQ